MAPRAAELRVSAAVGRQFLLGAAEAPGKGGGGGEGVNSR